MNLFDLQAKIELDSSGYMKGIGAAKEGMGKLSAWTVAKGQLLAQGIQAGTKALIGFGKQAIDSYAQYEQLVGGVETLFGSSAQAVQKYAADAYKTAGLSANEYMEQATSFSASLVQSLGGDTEQAAEYAHMAIVDMADNANKMGTSVQSIQNAYAGFAKGNYTMLNCLAA